jgi:hypothetical protein
MVNIVKITDYVVFGKEVNYESMFDALEIKF